MRNLGFGLARATVQFEDISVRLHRKSPGKATRLRALGLGLAVALALVGCGNSANTPGATAEPNTPGKSVLLDAKTPANTGDTGSLTLTIDGTTTTMVADDCTLQDLGGKLFVIGAGDLVVHLPAEPGSFVAHDKDVTVLLPSANVEKSEDEFSASDDAAGQWSLEGDRASGHVEGTAQTIDNRINDGPASSFSFDFACPYQDISN